MGSSRGSGLGIGARPRRRPRHAAPRLLAFVLATALLATIRPDAIPVQAIDRPNIVVFITDDQPWYTMPSILPVTPMPYLESRVRDPADHWVVFENAFLNTPICCPTRATILTGRYSHHTGVETNGAGLADETSTIATWLHGGGYHTGLVGKYINRYPFGRAFYKPPGWDRWAANYWAYYNYRSYVDGKIVSYGATPADYSTDVIADKAAAFIDTAPTDRPFFLYVAPKAMHDPYTPAPRHEGAFQQMAPVRFPNFNEADVTDKPAWVRARGKAGASWIASLDQRRIDAFETLLSADDAVRDVFEALERRGELDDTVFIFMSDNGFAIGEHRWYSKKCEFDICTRTPFLVRFPSTYSRTEDLPVSSVDVAATIADLAGVTPATQVDGISIAPLLTNTATDWRDGVLLHAADDDYQSPGYWGVNTGDALYVELTTGERELYDMGGVAGPADPWQLQNRIMDPTYATLRDQLAALLIDLRGGPVVANVSVTDGGLSPTVVSGPAGVTVRWSFGGSSPHRVADGTGLGLFDSGLRAPATTFSTTVTVAGSYPYTVDGSVAGNIAVPIRTGPPAGGTSAIYMVTWASLRPSPGMVADIQVKRPGSTGFVDWRVGSTVASGTFKPDAGKGIYEFRARLRRTSDGVATGWSPTAIITIS